MAGLMAHFPELPSEVGPQEPVPVPLPQISAAELTVSARIGAFLFKNRGWLPILFIGVPLLVPGHAAPERWVIGGVLILIGELIRLAGVAAAGTTTRRRSRNVERLVTYGIFAWSRNPLYNGNFLVWIGFCVISGVMWFLPIAVLIFAAEYSLIVRYEEGVLESTFGRQYLDYKNCVPRWLPKKPDDPPTGEYNWGEALKSEVSTFIQYAVLIIAFAIKGYYNL
jgi:protein-S-isoprenylcysteine O-methyltransferase Ste14